jgi:glyoxylase-like metal-dependent hydrolase (beta-lactamase superfamily II)
MSLEPTAKKLFAFHCGGEVTDMAVLDPFDPAVGRKVSMPYFFYVIEHPEGTVLFDTGLHPSVRDGSAEHLGEAASTFDWQFEVREGDDVVSKLASIGLRPEDIGHVAHSHLHYDHAGGIESFAHASFYVQRSELPFAFDPPVYQRSFYWRADFDHPVGWTELDGDYDVFNDGSLILFPTPGHTPGHQSLLVRLAGMTVVLAADALFLPGKLSTRSIPAGALAWSPDEMVRSFERLEEETSRHAATLITSHDTEYERSVRLAPAAWYE